MRNDGNARRHITLQTELQCPTIGPDDFIHGWIRVKMKFRIVNSHADPFYNKRANWYNEQFTANIRRDLEKNYMKEIRMKNGRQDMDIINCYESASLAHELYACLVEDDNERLRQTVQHLADEKMNDIVSILVELGYTF